MKITKITDSKQRKQSQDKITVSRQEKNQVYTSARTGNILFLFPPTTQRQKGKNGENGKRRDKKLAGEDKREKVEEERKKKG